MSYKLNRLRIESFVGIDLAEILFNTPVTLFIGRNNQGKSSVENALEFAFTGKARGTKTFKDAKALQCRGGSNFNEDSMKVELGLEIDGAEAVIKRSAKTASKNVENYNPLIPYCLNPDSFISLPAKERGKILARVLGGGMADLVRESIEKYIGKFAPEIERELVSSGVDRIDIDAIRECVTEFRREKKRDLKVMDKPEPKLLDFGLAANFDITDTMTDIEGLGVRIQKGRDLIADNKTLNQKRAKIIDIKKMIKDTDALIEKPTGEVDPVMIKTVQKARDIIDYILLIDGCENVACPVCRQTKFKTVGWKEVQAINISWLAGVEEQLKAMDEYEERKASLSRMNHQLLEWEIEIKDDARVLPAGSEKLLQDYIDKRDLLINTRDKYREYKAAIELHQANKSKAQKLGDTIAECNRIDDGLKDGGLVRESIAAGGEEFPINKKLLEVWGMESMSLKDNGEIELKGGLIELASESEKYRAACVMSLALADIGDVGFCVLDEYNTLDHKNSNLLFGAIEESDINNVLIMRSVSKEMDFSKIPDWLEVYKVDGGQVIKA